ncbi:class I adenylate-forming enzyme family protein [Siminovitchia sp. 179-K 8D1 HS]|uniref:class I adenylate-forming enzyme family protein n=1 Tax=Siminovitchia sp. 179-K 8D1 HS TaxID=3142385 RepID=UPI0039A15270
MASDTNQLSVYRLLKEAEAKFGQNEAVYDLTHRVSYSQLLQDADLIAASLLEMGLKKGDRIGAALPNWYETAALFFAVAKIGAILVPFNPVYQFHEIKYILENSKPKALFITKRFNRQILSELDSPISFVISVRFKAEGLINYNELLMGSSVIEETPVDVNNDVYCILYTSGTTGVPKGVMITHRSVVQSGNTIAGELYCTNEDVFIIAAPLFHIFGMACNLFSVVSVGARMVLKDKFHPREMLELIEQEKVTIHQGVPTMFLKELAVEDFEQFDVSSLRAGMVGASPIPANKVKEIRDRLGMNLCQSYGITETGSVTMTPYNDSEEKITTTLGKAIPGVKLKIVDEGRNELPPGEIGEIAIHSFGNMKGYYQMPKETSGVLDDEGWFYTGDLGKLDEEGYLYFIGRAKEMIIRGGFNIYPQEIEALLSKHPAVDTPAVIGLPDEVLGEIVCAVIQLKSGADCTEDELKEYLKERLATYKIPEKFVFTKDFPVTASGKIQKMKLREQLAAKEGASLNGRL